MITLITYHVMFISAGCELLGSYDLHAFDVEQTLLLFVQVCCWEKKHKLATPKLHLLHVRESTETQKSKQEC